VELASVSGGYQGHPVFVRTTLNLYPGQFAGIVGPTGSGKTTLLKVILGIEPALSGEIRIFGYPLQGKTPAGIGYVPQVDVVDWNFPVTVEEVVLMGRYREMAIWPWTSRKDKRHVRGIMDRLGIGNLAKRHIRALSGGQQQRVFLARALVGNPRLLILDEPTSGVDVKTQHDVLHLLHEMSRDGVTILLTTHDLNSMAAHLPWLFCFNQTVIAEGTPLEVLTPEILQMTYGAEMEVIRHGDFLLTTHASPLNLQKPVSPG
jgi:zinc/manganese transport system ATP-binding protein/zinc transport system ATP-binding protein